MQFRLLSLANDAYLRHVSATLTTKLLSKLEEVFKKCVHIGKIILLVRRSVDPLPEICILAALLENSPLVSAARMHSKINFQFQLRPGKSFFFVDCSVVSVCEETARSNYWLSAAPPSRFRADSIRCTYVSLKSDKLELESSTPC